MDLVRYARIGAYTALFLIPFTVLIVADWLFFPFITGKNFAFRVLVEIIFALWVVVALYQPEYRLRWTFAHILGGLFVFALGASTFFAENPTKAFWSNFERMEGYITLLHLAAYVTVLSTMLRTEDLWRRFTLTSLSVSAIVALYALLQLSGAFTINQGGVRIDATLGNATYFALYMGFHVFLAFYALIRWVKGNILRYALGILAFLQVVLVIFAATRGTIFGLFGGLALTGLITLFVSKRRRLGAIIIALLVVLGGIFFLLRESEFVQSHPALNRVANISLAEGATRLTIWGMAYQGFLERPVFGWGQEGFNYVFNKYYEPSLYKQEPWFDRAHNVYLDWLIAGGAVGAALYISLYLVLIYYLWRPGSAFDGGERAVLTGLIAAYAFHNLFVFDNLMSYILFFALFSYIVTRSSKSESTGEPLLKENSIPLVAGVTAVATLIVIYAVNAPGYATARDLILGLQPHQEGIQKNLEYLVRANERGGLGGQEAGEQFLQFAMQVRGQGIGDAAFQQQAAVAAQNGFAHALAVAPNDARLLVFYGSFLRQFGEYSGARETIQRALELSPEKQGIMLEAGIVEYADKKYDAALTIFERIYELSPDFNQIQQVYAGAAIVAGKESLARELLLRHFSSETPNDITILQSYITAKRYDRAITIGEARAAALPADAEAQKLLAGIYLEAGRRAEARAVIERAAARIPSFKTEAEEILRTL